MALNIQTSISTNTGEIIPNAYARISVNQSFSYDYITTDIAFYYDKIAYQEGALAYLMVNFNGITIPGGFAAQYTREDNGVDLLRYAHELWIAKLAELGIPTQIELD